MQIKLMGLALLLLTVTGCVGTKITSSWTAPAAQVNTASVKKIVVVGLFSDKDRQIREHMEAHLVG
ncbi:MAG: hypothetical protein GXC72_06865, partial [Chitinophagaceae bacterium]|nr:hypothetical protein [Chitinophagaceae bacterium]